MLGIFDSQAIDGFGVKVVDLTGGDEVFEVRLLGCSLGYPGEGVVVSTFWVLSQNIKIRS